MYNQENTIIACTLAAPADKTITMDTDINVKALKFIELNQV